MATLTVGTLMDDAAITAAFDASINGAVFDYTVANAGETLLVTAHLCRVEVMRVFSNGASHQEGTADSGETMPTNFTPVGSTWRFVVRGEANENRFAQVDVI